MAGDDGIAVAYALAILEDDTLKHPALEVVITTDEEVGLLGATALDTSLSGGNLSHQYGLRRRRDPLGRLRRRADCQKVNFRWSAVPWKA